MLSKIAYGIKPFISCELGINHNGDLDTALKMIESAAANGADGVKVQLYRTEDFCNDKYKQVTYKQVTYKQADQNNLGYEEVTLKEYDMFKHYEIDVEFVASCYLKTKELGLVFGITTTNKRDVKRSNLYCDYYKVASDMVHKKEMINEMHLSGKPVIIATGHLELSALRDYSYTKNTVFLHCVSEYPCKDSKLWKIKHMQEIGLLTGFSDHSKDIDDSLRAIELGALFIEKHFTLDESMAGPDHWYSMTPEELKKLHDKIC